MIHDAILTHVQEVLQEVMIDDLVVGDVTRAGAVLKGPLQGDPDPDAARISITLHENDPDVMYKPGTTAMTDSWEDQVAEIECGGSVTWKRRFTVKARCLFAATGEALVDARQIASTVRDRLEKALLGMSFSEVSEDGEYVSMGIWSNAIKGEMVQAGGPPDSYDYHIKIRFELQTTKEVIP